MPKHHPKQTKKVDPPASKNVSSKRLGKIKKAKEEEKREAAEAAAVKEPWSEDELP